jgi:hypothetical protein
VDRLVFDSGLFGDRRLLHRRRFGCRLLGCGCGCLRCGLALATSSRCLFDLGGVGLVSARGLGGCLALATHVGQCFATRRW